MNNEKVLCKFYWDAGRMGEVSGVFVTYREYVDKLIGKDVYFGEILGKHSEVYGTLDKEDIDILEVNPEFIDLFDHLRLETGYNPITTILEDSEYTDDNFYILNDGTRIKDVENE